MNDEFQWWLLLVGLVIGALLVFLVMVDFTRSADEQTEAELAREAHWMARLLRPTDGEIDPALIHEILRLHREWLAGATSPAIEAAPPFAQPPPDEPPPDEDRGDESPASASAPWHPDARSTSDMESDGA
jgi:hypothetical protein